jgi:hypothetical protein
LCTGIRRQQRRRGCDQDVRAQLVLDQGLRAQLVNETRTAKRLEQFDLYSDDWKMARLAELDEQNQFREVRNQEMVSCFFAWIWLADTQNTI